MAGQNSGRQGDNLGTSGHFERRWGAGWRFRGGSWVLAVCCGLGLGGGELQAQSTGGTLPSFEQLPVLQGLPDPLKMRDGTPVKSRDDWYNKRRPELKQLFQHYMYGTMPPRPEGLVATVQHLDKQALNGKATLKDVTIRLAADKGPELHLLLLVPNQRKRPAPVFVGLNFCGNHTVLPDPKIRLPQSWLPKHCKGCVDFKATDEGRGTQVDVWCAEYVVERGYALATCYCGDILPDKNEFREGVVPLYLKPGQEKPGPSEWGAISAWAWGIHRLVDYLVTDADLDPQRIGVVGHSRLGKTALLAGAFDERLALVVPHQSGTGGAALSRQNDQETVERINRVFPHWFCDNFKPFAGKEDKLPVDQHLLMALVAPRPLLDTEGDQDKWANYDSSFRALQAADPVYKLLGAPGLQGTGIVNGEASVAAAGVGNLVQYRRDSKHVMSKEYWIRILDFADKHLPAK